MSNNHKNIKFVYIGNTSSNSKIGEYSSNYDPSVYDQIARIYETSLSCNREVVKFGNSKDQDTYILLNKSNNTLFFAVTQTTYKKELVVELFREMEKSSINLLVDSNGHLNENGKKSLKSLVDSFQNKTTMLDDLNSDIDQVKVELRENINKQIASNDKSEELSDKASKIKDNANMFKENSSNLQKKTCMQNLKWTIIIIILILALLLIIIVPIIVNSSGNKENAPKENPSTNNTLRFLIKNYFD